MMATRLGRGGRRDRAIGSVGAQRRCAPTDITDITNITDTANTTNITNVTNITGHHQHHRHHRQTATQRPVVGVMPTNVIPGSSGAIVRAIKSATTKRINALRGTPAAPVPGRDDNEHIIRYETSLNRNIAANPSRWADDRDHPRHPLRRRANAPGAGV